MRSGIIAGGNWIVDHVKLIQTWPSQDTLTSILDHSRSNGGSPYNILIDLARLGAPFPLTGVGLVGDDENGQAIIRNCQEHRIDTTQLRRITGAATSYTDVMTVDKTGRRTFFHQRGANALLDVDDFDFTTTPAKLFHLGYLLLLDRLDAIDDGYPRACQVLRRAKAAGLRTSLDCVSEDSDRFKTIVVPALPDVDVLFANDYEVEKLTDIKLRQGNALHPAAVEAAARVLLGMGVRSWVVIHSPEVVYACPASGHGLWQPSLRMPAAEVRGTAGAGDALAAGILFGVHEEWSMADSLKLGVCAAAASLSDPSCSAGILSLNASLALAERYGYKHLP
jgi:sugar/nucleoside kinase (ribokinase family)